MAINFPNTPSYGDIFGRYKWDGEKWILAAGGRGSVAIPWLPSQLATLRLWLKGESNTASDGSLIGTWTDSSGYGNHASGPGINSPVVATAGLNGRNVVRFASASSQYFTLPNFLTGNAAGSAIWVTRIVNDPPPSSEASGGPVKFGSDSGLGGDNHYPYTDHIIHDDFGNNSRRNLGTRPGSFTAWHMASMHAAAADFRVYINGATFYLISTNTVSWLTAPLLGRGYRLSSSSTFFDGWMAELIFVNEALSIENRQRLEGYLASKWGLQSVLPSSHPYKVNPPMAGGVPPTPPSNWNQWDKATNIVLTNNDLTASASSVTSAAVRGSASKVAGYYYFEVTCTGTIGNSGVGIAPLTADLTQNAVGKVYINVANGVIFVDAVNVGSMGFSASPGSVICIAVNMTSKKIWFRVNNNPWNGSGAIDPAIGIETGGADISPVFGSGVAAYPVVTFDRINLSHTANFGGSAFAYAVPSGYTAGWPA